MFCKYCGNEILEHDVFCSSCGKEVDGDTDYTKKKTANGNVNLSRFSLWLMVITTPVILMLTMVALQENWRGNMFLSDERITALIVLMIVMLGTSIFLKVVSKVRSSGSTVFMILGQAISVIACLAIILGH